MGGNLINYPEDIGTNTAALLLIKILLYSVISMPEVRFMGQHFELLPDDAIELT